MTPPVCPLLDDYLAGVLGDADRARFAAHLPDCPECGRAVSEHESLAALLSEAVARLDALPAGLSERVGRRVRAARRRRLAAATAALAAAVAGLWLFSRSAPPFEPEAPARDEQTSLAGASGS